jgi:hypothetical protein
LKDKLLLWQGSVLLLVSVFSARSNVFSNTNYPQFVFLSIHVSVKLSLISSNYTLHFPTHFFELLYPDPK